MQETYTDWTLVSLSDFSRDTLIAVGLAVFIGMLFVVWSYRGSKKPWLLMGLRAVGALLILGFLIEPALQLRVVRKVRNRLAIIVDRSASMGLETGNGGTRIDAVRDIFKAPNAAFDEVMQSHSVEWFDLDGPITTQRLGDKPTGEITDIVQALERARDAGAGKPLAGILLFSDGADNKELEGAKGGDSLLSPQALARLERLGAPVNTVDAASAGAYKDVAVTEVISDEFAFVHNTIEIDVALEARGFGALTIPTTLRRENEIIATQEAAVSDGKTARVVFKIKPDRIGEFVYTVSIPNFAGEAVVDNNSRSFVIQVIRDKIRVLQVAGRPSWDERFLRQHLKENPNVDLISFFILRTPTDDASVSEDELSLIPFPVDKIFNTELHTFDVVVFQNFDYRPYRMEMYLRNIRNAVRAGLGFVMIGGPQSFADGGYLGSEFDEIIPVSLSAGGVHKGLMNFSLTNAGKVHPITDLSRGGNRDNSAIWQNLPTWPSLNFSGGLMPGATALVTEERLRGGDGSPLPLIAVMDVEEGRSMAVVSDSMWRWRFGPRGDGGASERAYHRFWSNALRWLVRDPEHSRVRVLPGKRRYDIGEPVDVTVQVFGDDYRPKPFAHLRLTLEEAGSGSTDIDDIATGDSGAAKQRYESLGPGAYRVTAKASASGEQIGEGNGVFVIDRRSLEFSRGAPRPDLLRAVADATGGADFTLDDDLWEELRVVDPEVIEVDKRRNVELWDNGWALAGLVIILAGEWALRRRRGYL